MKLKTDISIGSNTYSKGSYLHWSKVYGFFTVIIALHFWLVFDITYIQQDIVLGFTLCFGIFLPVLYLLAYRSIFGLAEIRWLIVNSIIGIIGVLAELDWVLSYFYDKSLSDFNVFFHIIPCVHYIMFTFVLRQAVIDSFHARYNLKRREYVNLGFTLISTILYVALYFAS